jgi:hypothetical protein
MYRDPNMDTEVEILGELMPRDMFQDLADMLSPTLRGYKYGCAPADFVCPICYESSTATESLAVVITECDHMYHLDCLELWTELRNTCPQCRNIMPGCTKVLVEELLLRLKEEIKMRILQGWWHKLDGLTPEQIGVVKEQMQAFVDSHGWNTSSFTMTLPEYDVD